MADQAGAALSWLLCIPTWVTSLDKQRAKIRAFCQARWLMPTVPALGTSRLEDRGNFKGNLGYVITSDICQTGPPTKRITELTSWLSPDGVDCSRVVTSMHKSVCFNPHGQPVQVGYSLDHIHCHRCHLCTFHRQG